MRDIEELARQAIDTGLRILMPVHGKQVLTCLRLTRRPLGVLLNFGGTTFREGIRRIVNNHTDLASSRLRVNQTALIQATPIEG